ncbi:hypothetical protein E8E14_013967 [Neopestalotiopsis sp. 37M]|nr:hypothetical protein E8E14_013967 [Neopestalotiopsis sp. 37M]
MAEVIPQPTPSGENSYKYTWARYVARRTLDNDLAQLKARVDAATNTAQGNPLIPQLLFDEATPLRDVVKAAQDVTGSGVVALEPGKFKVAIVGAGVAGLFSAMLFEWLNEKIPALEIKYDLIEAAGEERLGGRLYTHYFSELSDEDKKKGWVNHDYYDVGAMRYPENDIMRRTFQLFKMLGMQKFDEQRQEAGDKEKVGDLIPYYMKDGEKKSDHGVCPSYFNNIRQVGKIFDSENPPVDPYNLNSGLPEGSKIPEALLSQDPGTLVGNALKPLMDLIQGALDERRQEKQKNREVKDAGFWEFMDAADHMSTRQYLALNYVPKKWERFLQEYHQKHQHDKDYVKWEPPSYNYNTIEWLETATYGTGWYDQALSETVLEELDFHTKEKEKWWCISGGTQTVPRTMASKISEKVQFNSQVVAINANVQDHMKTPKEYVPLTLTIDKSYPNDPQADHQRRKEDYLAVFNSTTLAAMQRMDLQNAGLLWGTKQAIRSLGYGASCKVAIKFKTPWWQLEPYNINKGSVSRTDLPLRVCVYPSYNIEALEGPERWEHSKHQPSVLLCSYTWGQDAQRIGSLISRDHPEDGQGSEKDKQLKSLLLRNLALLHATGEGDSTYENLLARLEHEYVDHHAWDWYRDENMSGAFAYFGPSQYSNMWQEIIKPNAFGQLYLVGEASSAHHAWIVGALESVVRATYFLFEGLQSGNKECDAYKQAMELLQFGQYEGQEQEKIEKDLPFFPLPAEMPRRQEGTGPKSDLTDLPEEAGANKPLTFAAAVAALSLVESFFELVVPTMEQNA